MPKRLLCVSEQHLVVQINAFCRPISAELADDPTESTLLLSYRLIISEIHFEECSNSLLKATVLVSIALRRKSGTEDTLKIRNSCAVKLNRAATWSRVDRQLDFSYRTN